MEFLWVFCEYVHAMPVCVYAHMCMQHFYYSVHLEDEWNLRMGECSENGNAGKKTDMKEKRKNLYIKIWG